MVGLGHLDLDRRERNLRRVSEGGAFATIGISTAVFLSWVTHAARVEAAMPFLFEMKANTALGFGAAGAGLLLLGHRPPKKTAILAAVPLSIGLFTLLEYISGARLGIDELLTPDWSAEIGGFPGRPSPNSAALLVASGAALAELALARPGNLRRIAVKFICFAMIALAMTALAGYLAGSDLAIGWGTARKMAIPTALCGLALGAGIMASSWKSDVSAIARISIWIPALLTFAVVLFDLLTPRGINAGICYIPLVFCALWFERPNVAIIFAAISTLLVLFGLFASPPGNFPFWPEVLNRGLAIFAIWMVSILVFLQRTAGLKLQRNAHHLITAQEIASAGSFELDFATMMVRGSGPFDAMHGIEADADRRWSAFAARHIPPDERPAVDAMAAAARRGEQPDDLDSTFMRSDGAVRNSVLHCEVQFDYDQAPTGIIGVVHDVTELKQAQVRQADIESQLRHAQKLEALGTLAGTVAHDLNNTLVPITTLTPLLLEECDDAAEREVLELIMGSARRAKELVREILAFSRKDEPTHGPVYLDLLVREALTIIRAGVPSSIDIIDALEPVPELMASKGQLYQVVLNLATNAAYAIGKGSGAITFGTHCDRASADEARDSICFYVADNGAGMDEATRKKIFDPFFSTKARDGTGLGLSIVGGIVANHGGSIAVQSAPGAGARFDISFPVGDEAIGAARA